MISIATIHACIGEQNKIKCSEYQSAQAARKTLFDNTHLGNYQLATAGHECLPESKNRDVAGMDQGRKSIPVWTGFNPGCNGIAPLNSGVELNNSFRMLIEGQGGGYPSSEVNEKVHLAESPRPPTSHVNAGIGKPESLYCVDRRPSSATVLGPIRPIQCPVLDCLRDVLALDLRAGFHVGNRPRD